MANKQWYGPLWILPEVVGAGLNAGVNITTGQTVESTEYQEDGAKGLMVSCPTDNGGDVYLVMRFSDGTYKMSNAGTVVAVIAPGTVFQLPQASYDGNRYKLSDYGIDAESGDIAYPVGIMQ